MSIFDDDEDIQRPGVSRKVKPLNITERCPNHPYNPVASQIKSRNPKFFCYQCYTDSISYSFRSIRLNVDEDKEEKSKNHDYE